MRRKIDWNELPITEDEYNNLDLSAQLGIDYLIDIVEHASAQQALAKDPDLARTIINKTHSF